MTSRKITVDNSVRYIPKNEQTKERDSKPRTTKAGSLPRKQNKKRVIIDLYFRTLKVISEQKLIWLKMKLDWF